MKTPAGVEAGKVRYGSRSCRSCFQPITNPCTYNALIFQAYLLLRGNKLNTKQ
ncbi:MAG: hypothetical protein JWL65_2194 [Gammaproteobacteria bacterium]|nr:hypothetical protein [Gammaproteobacteria bacterium]